MDLVMRYFGPERWGPEDALFIPIPPNKTCLLCTEPITLKDYGVRTAYLGAADGEKFAYEHRECFLRQVYGSVAHQQGRCSCYGGDGEDDPKLTKREAARAAVLFYEGGGKESP